MQNPGRHLGKRTSKQALCIPDFKINKYHKIRVPFFLKPDGLIYSVRKYPYSHEMWAKQLGLPLIAMRCWARGFYWQPDNRLYFYYGDDTRDYLAVANNMAKFVKSVMIAVACNFDTTVHGGMIPGEPGQVWECITDYGTVRQFHDSYTTGIVKSLA